MGCKTVGFFKEKLLHYLLEKCLQDLNRDKLRMISEYNPNLFNI